MDTEEETVRGLYRYMVHEEPTVEFLLSEVECREEAAEMKRLGSHEAEGFWLAMAAGFAPKREN